MTPTFASPSCLALDAHAKLEGRAAIAGPGLSWEWSKAGEQGQEMARLTLLEPVAASSLNSLQLENLGLTAKNSAVPMSKGQ